VRVNLIFIFKFYIVIFFLQSIFVLSRIDLIDSIVKGIELAFLFFLSMRILQNWENLHLKERFFILVISILFVFHFLFVEESKLELLPKIIAPIVFYFTGKYLVSNKAVLGNFWKLFLYLSLFIFPFVILIYQKIINDLTFYSIFVNSNNFSYYFIVVSVIINLIFPTKQLWVFFFIGIGFILSSTLGALLAFSISSLFCIQIKILKKILVFFIFLSLFLLLINTFFDLNSINILKKLEGTFETASKLLNINTSISELSKVEYSEAINFSQNNVSNLSFLFRIKNWTEIIESISKSSNETYLFGVGLGNTVKFTSTHLVAHNDYLGLFFEVGVLLSIILIFSYLSVLMKLGRSIILIPFYTIAIYHFTENLYFNFLITSLHFFLLGFFNNRLIKKHRYESSPNK